MSRKAHSEPGMPAAEGSDFDAPPVVRAEAAVEVPEEDPSAIAARAAEIRARLSTEVVPADIETDAANENFSQEEEEILGELMARAGVQKGTLSGTYVEQVEQVLKKIDERYKGEVGDLMFSGGVAAFVATLLAAGSNAASINAFAATVLPGVAAAGTGPGIILILVTTAVVLAVHHYGHKNREKIVSELRESARGLKKES